jgi:hypothetical protein
MERRDGWLTHAGKAGEGALEILLADVELEHHALCMAEQSWGRV